MKRQTLRSFGMLLAVFSVGVFAQDGGGTTPAITGVVAAGTTIEVVKEGFNGTEGPLPQQDGGILFTENRANQIDPGVTPAAGEAPPPTVVYHLAADGKLARIASDIRRPNGVALSPDERRLYVANTAGEWVIAFDLDATGTVTGRHDFARLAGVKQGDNGPTAGADGLTVDETGRLYAATAAGVQVFSPRGEPRGIIVLPRAPQNLAFAGRDRSLLYVVGRGAVYRIATQTHGPQRAGK